MCVICLCTYVCAYSCEYKQSTSCFWSLQSTLFEIGSLFVVAFVGPQVVAIHWMFLALASHLTFAVLGFQIFTPKPGVYLHSGDPKSGLHTHRDSALPTEPSPLPQTIFKEKYWIFATIIQILIIPCRMSQILAFGRPSRRTAIR